MRISSGIIGMESARSYASYTTKQMNFSLGSREESLEDREEGLEKQTTDENPFQTLTSTLEEMRSKMRSYSAGNIKNANTEEWRAQLMEIRQQCLNFLMDILFPDRSSQQIFNLQNVNSQNFSQQYFHAQEENTSFSTQGTVKCADGREITFDLNLEMSRSFQTYYEESISYLQMPLYDPLVINLEGNIAELSNQTFFFDIDADGEEDELNRLEAGSGFLALDRNEDGIINDGSELFGTKSGNGFEDLKVYDTDRDGFIDEDDEIWSKLKIWIMEEGGEPKLYSLAQKGVGAIGLQNVSTDFSLTDEANHTKGIIRNTGIFLYENGNVGTIQHIDMNKK